MNSGGSLYKIESLKFYFPGERIELSSLDLNDHEQKLVEKSGQRFTYTSTNGSTALALEACKKSLENRNRDKIGLVISASSLLTSTGLEIPAISLRSDLKLLNAQCLNITQGCTGVLAGLKLAKYHILENPEEEVLLSVYSSSSNLMKNQNFGSFFWADGAGSFILRKDSGNDPKGIHYLDYFECNSEKDQNAMRVNFGDQLGFHIEDAFKDLSIKTQFSGPRAQMDYIQGEIRRFQGTFDQILERNSLSENDIEGILVPSTGKNRLPNLFKGKEDLIDKVKGDFSMAHMGGVDPFITLNNIYEEGVTGKFIILSPAFTAQWAGVLLEIRG